jgi:hypothetical protein
LNVVAHQNRDIKGSSGCAPWFNRYSPCSIRRAMLSAYLQN